MSVEAFLPGGSAGLFLGTQALGLSVWLTLAVVNNGQAFRSSVGAVGATMTMAPLYQSPPIDTPLLKRAVRSPRLHQFALLVVLVLQIVAAVAAWVGSYQLVLGDGLAVRPAMAQPGTQRLFCVRFRDAAGWLVVWLLDSSGRPATDAPGAVGLGAVGVCVVQPAMGLMSA